MKKNHHLVQYFSKNLLVVIGLVLIWRGIWYVLDAVDVFTFGGSHFYTSIFGVILGLFILYIPDGDLKEIQKL